jgi:hypothetical protein
LVAGYQSGNRRLLFVILTLTLGLILLMLPKLQDADRSNREDTCGGNSPTKDGKGQPAADGTGGTGSADRFSGGKSKRDDLAAFPTEGKMIEHNHALRFGE